MILRPGLTFRLIVHPRRDGRLNMAVDEALLQSVGGGEDEEAGGRPQVPARRDAGVPREPGRAGAAGGRPVLRLYGFSPATLSLGRFQAAAGRLHHDRLAADGVTLVRRPTGGQAVLHDDELTYSVVLGRGHLEPFGKREIYRFISGLLLEGLAVLGVAGVVNRQRRGSPYNPDCFGTAGEYEIASRIGEKLVGSAQLVTRRASLQHGAIPLGDSYRRIDRFLDTADGTGPAGPGEEAGPRHAPGCLEWELGRKVPFEEAAAAFREGFRRRLAVEDSELTDREWEAARQLEREKYSTDSWNLRL